MPSTNKLLQDGQKETRLTSWAKEPTVSQLRQDLLEAKSAHDSHVSQVNHWLNNLYVRGPAKIKSNPGFSSLVPKLIRKQAEWRYAALSEPFLSTDDIFNVYPVTFEDKQGAIQNGLILNNQFNTKLNKVNFIDAYVRAAVNEGTVIVRVGWDYRTQKVNEDVPVLEYRRDPSQLPLMQQLDQWQQNNNPQYAQLPPEIQQAHALYQQHGEPYSPVITGTETKTVEKVLRNQPTVQVCDYRNVILDPSCEGNPEQARFAIYGFETSMDELKKAGIYKNLQQINTNSASPLNAPDYTSADDSNFNFSDDSRKRIVAYEYWGQWDIDGSGTTKPIVATFVNNTMIRMEENPFPDKSIPFVVVPYLPVPKSVFGEPDGELLEDNQKVVGAVTRGMIDILGRSANGQTGIRKDALDVTNRRKFDKGQDYEFNANVDPRQAIFMHTFPEIPQSVQFMLGMQNAEAESLTGVKAFNNGISGAGLGDTAAGVRGALDASSKRELGILRRLADGMLKIGRKIIAMNAEFLSEEEVVRVTNDEFVKVRRDDLPGNYDLRLTISTAEEDNQKAQELAFMLQTMGNSMDPSMSQLLLADIARLRKMPDLAKKIESYQPQPDPLAQQKAQLEIKLLEAQIAREQAMAQQNNTSAMLDQARAATEQARTRNLNSDSDLKDLDYVEQESGVKQERDLQKQGQQAEANTKMKIVEQSMKHNHSLLQEHAKADLQAKTNKQPNPAS